MDDDYTRPTSIPLEAFYVGGSDGGVYVTLRIFPSSKQVMYQALIFSDHSGKRLFDGLLTLLPGDSLPIDLSDTSQFAGWSGSALYLVDGRKLLAIPDVRPADLSRG